MKSLCCRGKDHPVSKLGLWPIEQGPELEKIYQQNGNMEIDGMLTDSADKMSDSSSALERALQLLEVYSKVC